MGRRRLRQPIRRVLDGDGRHEGADGDATAEDSATSRRTATATTTSCRSAWTSSQAAHGTVRIIDAAGTSRRLWKVADGKTWSTAWNGAGDDGKRLPNGTYVYRVNVRDRAGNLRIVDTSVLLDDTIKTGQWSPTSFDPRAGETSKLTVTLRRSATVSAAIYSGRHEDPDDLVRQVAPPPGP